MGWLKVDDRFRTNPKVVSAGAEGLALDVAGMCFCAENETDGFIPYAVVPSLFPVRQPYKVAQRLVDLNRWAIADGGFWVHDYLKYNPSHAELEKKRAATQQRVNDWRNARRNSVTSAVTNASSPTPSPNPSSSSRSDSHRGRPHPGETSLESVVLEREVEARLRRRRGDPINNPEAWKRKARAELLDEWGDEGLTQKVGEEQERLACAACALCDDFGRVELIDGVISRCAHPDVKRAG